MSMQPDESPHNINDWFAAAVNGDVDYVEKHAEDFAKLINSTGKTAFMCAAENGAFDVLLALAPLEAKVLSPDGLCALEYAILADSPESVSLLLKLECSVFEDSGKDILSVAVQARAAKTIPGLVRFINSVNPSGYAKILERNIKLADSLDYRDIAEQLKELRNKAGTNPGDQVQHTISGVQKIGGNPGRYMTADGQNLDLSLSVSFEASRTQSPIATKPRTIDYDLLLQSRDREIIRLHALVMQLVSKLEYQASNTVPNEEPASSIKAVEKLQLELAAAMIKIDELKDEVSNKTSLDGPTRSTKSELVRMVDESIMCTDDEIKRLKKQIYILEETNKDLEKKIEAQDKPADIAERKVLERILTENGSLKQTIKDLSNKIDRLSQPVTKRIVLTSPDRSQVHFSRDSEVLPQISFAAGSMPSILSGSSAVKLSVGLPRDSQVHTQAIAISPSQRLVNAALSRGQSRSNCSPPVSSTSDCHWAQHSDKLVGHVDASTPTQNQTKRSMINRPRGPVRRNTQWFAEQVSRSGRVTRI